MKLPENEEQETVFTVKFDEDVVIDVGYIKNFFRNFAEWYMLKADTETLSDNAYFSSLWYNFMRVNKTNYQKMYESLYATYNPLNEFEIEETHTKEVVTGLETFKHTPDGNSDFVKTTYNNSKDVSSLPTTKTFNATYTGGEKEYSKVENSGISETEQEVIALATYTDTKTKGNDKITDTISKNGNDKFKISEIVESEINMRQKYVLADIILGNFIHQYLFYSGGEFDL